MFSNASSPQYCFFHIPKVTGAIWTATVFVTVRSELNSPTQSQEVRATDIVSKERTRRVSRNQAWELILKPYLLSEDQFVNVMGKHGAGREHTGISGRHDCSRDSTQTNEGHSCWSEVLKYHGKDQSLIDIYWGCLVGDVTHRWFVERRLGPICRESIALS